MDKKMLRIKYKSACIANNKRLFNLYKQTNKSRFLPHSKQKRNVLITWKQQGEEQ